MKTNSEKEVGTQIIQKMNLFLGIIWTLVKLHLVVTSLLDLEIILL